MKVTPSTGFPLDIIEHNLNRLTPEQVQEWYKSLPFAVGVYVNSICWTAFLSHNDLVNAVKQLDLPLSGKIATIVAWYQNKQRSTTPFDLTKKEVA